MSDNTCNLFQNLEINTDTYICYLVTKNEGDVTIISTSSRFDKMLPTLIITIIVIIIIIIIIYLYCCYDCHQQQRKQ